jgi:hypothetical protein
VVFLLGIARELIMSLFRLPYQDRILRQSAVGSAIMQSIQLATSDVDALRTRLREMSDEELRKFGKAARYMVSSPTANMGKPPLPDFVQQLEEARAESRRRCEGPRLSSVSDSPFPLRMTPADAHLPSFQRQP